MKDLLLVIYMCWTPVDSMELAVQHGYVLESSTQYNTFLVEEWNINGRELEVTYTHPRIGDYDHVCYYSERWIDENNIERLPPNEAFNPGTEEIIIDWRV